MLQKVYAQVETTIRTKPDLGWTSLADVFNVAINIVLGAGIALTIIFLILGGIQYMTSKGDQKAVAQARGWLTNAVIGFIVVIGAFTIKTIIGNMIGGRYLNLNTVNSVINI